MTPGAPGPPEPANLVPAVWLGVYLARIALYLLSGGLLAKRPSPFGWRFWIALPGLMLSATEATLASALDRRLAPRGRWFIPLFALFLAVTSAAAAYLFWRIAAAAGS